MSIQISLFNSSIINKFSNVWTDCCIDNSDVHVHQTILCDVSIDNNGILLVTHLL